LLYTIFSCVILFKRKCFPFIFAILILYFWTIHGSIGILLYEIKIINTSPAEFTTYLTKEFICNNNYFISLLIYYIFYISLSTLILFYTKRICTSNYLMEMNNLNNIILILFFTMTSIIPILLSIDNYKNLILYQHIRNNDIEYFTIHQISNRILIIFSVLGFLSRKKYFRLPFNLFYLITIFILTSYMLLLGNKSEIFFAVGFFSVYIIQKISIFKFKYLIYLIPLIYIFGVANIFRGQYFSEYFESDMFSILIKPFDLIFKSGEFYSAHLSLFNVLEYEVNSNYLLIIKALLNKLILGETFDSYNYYADVLSIGDKFGPSQGSTIHNLVSFIISFSYYGIIFCIIQFAIIFYLLKKTLINLHIYFKMKYFLFTSLSFAYLPAFIRSGSESIRGFIYYITIFFICFLFVNFKIKKC